MVGLGNLQNVLLSLLGGVGDLTVVNDDGVAVSAALSVGPADGLGELGLRVGQEELGLLVSFPGLELELELFVAELTMSSPVTPLALPQALMT